MTEELARTKWCPMVRTMPTREDEFIEGLVPGPCSYNKVSTKEGWMIPTSTLCIASDCMMWRVEGNGSNLSYCGLAGKL